MDAIKTLLDRQSPAATPKLPAELQQLYGGDLEFPQSSGPYVVANFASTLDGVVSFKIPGKSTGGEISGHNPADRSSWGC